MLNQIQAMIDSVDAAAYETDLYTVAGVRNHGSPAWQETQDFCAERLAALGFEVELHGYGTGVNVIGTLAGTIDEQIIVSGHYDAVPDCEGADDNASGVSGALAVAKALSGRAFRRTLVVACWDEEEAGLAGANAYAKRARQRRTEIAGMVSLEMIGFKSDEPNSQMLPTGLDILFPDQVAAIRANDLRGDFITIVTDEASRALSDAFGRYADRVELPWIALALPTGLLRDPAISHLHRSDHSAFWSAGYPGLMLTDTANFRNLHYHCTGGPDTIDRLDTDFAVKIVQALVGATATQLGVR